MPRLRLPKAIALAVLCSFAFPASGAPPGSVSSAADPVDAGHIGVSAFDQASGLPGTTIQWLAFDRAKRLLVGTSSGVARLRGRTFEVLVLPHPEREDFVRAVIEEADGSILVARDYYGLVRLSRHGFTELGTADGLPNVRVNALYETRENGRPVVYAGTHGGLARIEGTTITTFGRNAPLEMVLAVSESDVLGPKQLFVGGDGGLFVKKGDAFERVPLPPEAAGGSVNSIATTKDAAGETVLWAGCYGRGVLRIDASGARLLGTADGLASTAVTNVATTRRDGVETIYAATRAAGVHRFDGSRFVQLPLGPLALEVFRVAGDDEGGLFIGTRGSGLLRMKSPSWRVLDTSTGLPSDHVWELAEADGPLGPELWLATSNGAVVHRGGRFETLTTKDGLPANEIASIAVTKGARGDVVWIGTQTNGLARLENGRITILDRSTGFFTDRPTRLLATGDTLWVAAGEVGIARISPTGTEVIAPPPGKAWARAVSLAALDGPSGPTVYCGQPDGVVAIERGRARTLDTSQLGRSIAIGMTEVTRPSGERELWAGFFRGLGRLREGSSVFEPVEVRNGTLPRGAPYQLVFDRQGHVFFGSPLGFARLTLLSDGRVDVTPLTRADELPTTSSNFGSLCDRKGRVFLATTGGLAVLDPGREASAVRSPRPLLLERAVSLARGTPIESGTLLRHDDSGALFSMALLDFATDRPSEFRTHLDGYEKAPGAWTTEDVARYTSLPPGQYVFRAWGRDHRGIVAGPVSRAFRVAPSPFRQPLAIALYVLAALALGAVLVRLRLAALRRRNRALEALVEARTREVTYARDEALAGSRTKSAFLASMSHELRTPLSAIIGYAELLHEDFEGHPDAAADLKRIENAARHQLQLVNEILDLSKIESGKLELHFTTFDLGALAREVATTVAPLLEKNRNRLVVEAREPAIPVRLDELRVKQILLNLLSNASKFTNGGVIELGIRSAGEDVELSVTDTGIGMTPEQLVRLFKPFTQADAGTAAQYGGTGLGLTIAKAFCELLGGSIQASSAPGRGSTFLVRLPRTPPAVADPGASGPSEAPAR